MKPKHRSSHVRRAVLIFALVSLAGGALSSAQAQSGELPFRAKKDGSVSYEDLIKLTRQAPARDSITDDELAAIKAKHEVEYGAMFKATDKTELPPRKDIYASSLILSDGVNHTLLPLRAIIFLPEKYQQRVVEEPVGKLILWSEFQQINRSWIRAFEISLDVARGDEPVNEALQRQYESGFQVVVSVYKNSPISMMPLKAPEQDTESTKTAGTGPVTTGILAPTLSLAGSSNRRR